MGRKFNAGRRRRMRRSSEAPKGGSPQRYVRLKPVPRRFTAWALHGPCWVAMFAEPAGHRTADTRSGS